MKRRYEWRWPRTIGQTLLGDLGRHWGFIQVPGTPQPIEAIIAINWRDERDKLLIINKELNEQLERYKRLLED